MHREGKSESDAKTLPPREAPQGKNKNDWQKGYKLGRWAGWRSESQAQDKRPLWDRMKTPPASIPPPPIPVNQRTTVPTGASPNRSFRPSNTLPPHPSQLGQRPPPPQPPHPPPDTVQPASPAGSRRTSPPASPPRPSASSSRASSRGRNKSPAPAPAGQMSHSKSRGSAGQLPPTAPSLQTTNLPSAPRRSILVGGPTWSPVSPEKASATTAIQTTRQASPPRRYTSPTRPTGPGVVQSSPSLARLRAQHEQDEQRKRQESEANFARNGPIQRFGRG